MARPGRVDPADIPARPDLRFEQALWDIGQQAVAGVDEAGRGALFGPVAAAAVILPARPEIAAALSGVHDSKQMSAAQRHNWAEHIRQHALAWGVGMASAAEIDRLGILPATHLAARRALTALGLAPQHILFDFLALPGLPCPQTSLVKGDCRSLSIAAASVLAKTARDALLMDMDGLYPGYGLAQHKGYGTAAHLEALRQRGPSPEHRRSFAPLRAQQLTLLSEEIPV